MVVNHRAITRNKLTKKIVDTELSQPLNGARNTFLNAALAWDESEPCKRLVSALQNLPPSSKVGRIVAFSCGSITRDRFKSAPRSSVQHALALTVSKVLTARQIEHVPCYAQDPCYGLNDEALLTEWCIDILDDPDGFLAVDRSTFVISIASDSPVRQIIADLAKPAAIIWDRVDLDDAPDSL
jgi:hypothetical protein